MSLATVPRSAAPLATAGVLLLALAPLAVTTTLGAQDTLRPPAAAATLGHAPSAPAVRVSLGEEALVPGDHGRVSVRTRADGWVVVLQADPTGHVRVLFPLDPFDSAQTIRGDADLVVRSRGGGRDAFTAGSALGDGTVLAAFSADRPFRAGRYARNGHWDPRAFPRVAAGADAEGELLALVGELLPRGARFDYDVAGYRVSEPLPVVATARAGEEGYAPEPGEETNVDAYDGAAAMPTGTGYTSSYFDDAFYYGSFGGYFPGFYGGIFPIVVVLPSSFHNRSFRRGFHGFGGIDPFFLSLGCPPVFFSPFSPFPHFDGPGRRSGGRSGYGVVYTGPRSSGPHLAGSPPPPVSKPYSYRNRPPAATGPTVYRSHGGAPPAQSGASPTAPSSWTPMPWHPMNGGGGRSGDASNRRDAVPVGRGAPPHPAPAAPASAAPAPSRLNSGGGATIWRAPAHTAPAASTSNNSSGGNGNAAHASPGGARIRPR